jgi:hypothetical protein
MSDIIAAHTDQVSSHDVLFHFNGLIPSFSFQFLSIKGHKLETRVYVGCSSLGHVHDLMYVGKEKPSHIYESLYTIFIRVVHVQLCKQFYF